MDTRSCQRCALLVTIQVASQHPETIISQPEKPGVKGEKRGSEECTQCRGDEPFGTRLSAGLPLQVGGSIPGGWLRAAVPEKRDSPLKDSGTR